MVLSLDNGCMYIIAVLASLKKSRPSETKNKESIKVIGEFY